MQVKTKYKKTEIGLIPEDWNIFPFCELGVAVDGDRGVNYPGQFDFFAQGFCLFLSAKNVTNKGFKFDDCIFISKKKDNQLNQGKLERNDVVLTTRGTVGNFAYFAPSVQFDNVRINSGMIILRLKSSKLRHDFFYEVLKSQVLSVQIEKMVFGSAQPQLTARDIKAFKILVPPLPEQRAIATALSDVDTLINSLDRLIAKKRDIKQATMQQLLTGKTRLPGFKKKDGFKQTEIGLIPEDWDLEPIDRLALIATGSKNTQDKIEDAIYPFFVRSSVVERINTFSFDGEAVLTAGDGVGTGKIFHYIKGKFDCHQRVYRMSDFSERVDGFYFYLYFSNNFYARIMSMTAKSSVDSVRREMIANMTIPLPLINEQIAISEVLSDMDADLSRLTERRDKTLLLKQGMMQELLTGRTRLV
ncbi:MAG: type restriction enzyme subunit [Cyanobacteriota bacterium erpe_2018_sw_21hr_WHONDRS-SW48-000092_B_bin.40]|jgi:type I restriction enzyme S subunit|nr:type restriction enzyme subunit [Cyanobacteriota bacterium erpe_2018_sw_21hr_WHONDRS-SW48-000092_B_bin.40]